MIISYCDNAGKTKLQVSWDFNRGPNSNQKQGQKSMAKTTIINMQFDDISFKFAEKNHFPCTGKVAFIMYMSTATGQNSMNASLFTKKMLI